MWSISLCIFITTDSLIIQLIVTTYTMLGEKRIGSIDTIGAITDSAIDQRTHLQNTPITMNEESLKVLMMLQRLKLEGNGVSQLKRSVKS